MDDDDDDDDDDDVVVVVVVVNDNDIFYCNLDGIKNDENRDGNLL